MSPLWYDILILLKGINSREYGLSGLPALFNPLHSVTSDLLGNQAMMSEEERDRILQEHEKHLAELESR